VAAGLSGGQDGTLEENGRGGFQVPSVENVKAREDATKQADEQAKAHRLRGVSGGANSAICLISKTASAKPIVASSQLSGRPS